MRSRRSAAARLEHIQDAIRYLEAFTRGKTQSDYLSQPMMRFAVERAIEILSEASRHLPNDLKARYGDIPWAEIAGIGNILRHEYQRVDDRELWRVVIRDLPPLKAAVEAMLREVEGESDGRA